MTSTDGRMEAEDSGPQRLRGGPAAPPAPRRRGPGRRAVRPLAALTDDWLAGLFAAGAERPARASPWSPSAATAAASSPRAATSTCCCCTTAAPTAAASPRSPTALWYPVWDLGLPSTTRSAPSPRPARRPRDDLKVQLGLLDARHVAGDADADRRGCGPPSSPTGAARRPSGSPNSSELVRGARRAPGRAAVPARTRPQGGARRAARRHRAARRRRLLARRRPPRGPRRRPHAACSTSATPCTWPPAAPPTGSPSRNRTRSPPRSACSTPTPCCAQVYEAARVVSYAADVTWREVGRVLRSRAVRRGCAPCWAAASRSRERSPWPRASSSRTARWCSPAPRAPSADPVLPLRAAAAAAAGRAAARRLHAVRALAAAAPAAARAVARRGPRAARHACSAPAPPPSPSGRRWTADGLIDPAAARVGAGALPPAAQPRAPLHRRPAPGRDRRRGAAELTREVDRPDLLLVAALLHDIGKGWPGDHSVAGETIAARRRRPDRLRPRATSTVIATLVRHHLLLRRHRHPARPGRPGDRRARSPTRSATPSTLDLLHALTEADARPPARPPGRLARLARRRPGQTGRRGARRRRTGGPRRRRAHRRAGAARHRGGRAPAARCWRCARRPNRDRASSRSERPGTGRRGTAHRRTRPAGPAARGGRRAGPAPADRPRRRPARLDLRIGVDGSVLLLSWRVAAEYGSLPQAARLRADLVRRPRRLAGHPGRSPNGSAAYPRRRGAVPPRRRGSRSHPASRPATVIEVRAQDAPGLLHRIGRALEEAGVRVRSTHVSHPGRERGGRLLRHRPGRARPLRRRGAGRARWPRRVERDAARREPRQRARSPDTEPVTLSGGRRRIPWRATSSQPPPTPRTDDRRVRYLSDRLSATFKNLRGKGRLSRGGHRRHGARDPHRAARGRCRPARRPDVHQERQGARPRRRGLPGAEPGPAGPQDRQRRARHDPRRRDPAPALRQAAARR